jgi:hypothetical protein
MNFRRSNNFIATSARWASFGQAGLGCCNIYDYLISDRAEPAKPAATSAANQRQTQVARARPTGAPIGVLSVVGRDRPECHAVAQPRGFRVENPTQGVSAEFTAAGVVREEANHWGMSLPGWRHVLRTTPAYRLTRSGSPRRFDPPASQRAVEREDEYFFSGVFVVPCSITCAHEKRGGGQGRLNDGRTQQWSHECGQRSGTERVAGDIPAAPTVFRRAVSSGAGS